MSKKLDSLKRDIVAFLNVGDLTENTINLLFDEFEATNIIDIKGSEFFKNLDDHELRKYISEKEECNE
ncbi:MAG: hypothetical protein ACEPOW_13955 [Bacteroidales bacterium]